MAIGFIVDLDKGQIEIPAERVAALRSKLQSVCLLQRVPAKTLASVVGSIISMSLAIGPVSRFMTRSMYSLLETRLSWWETGDYSRGSSGAQFLGGLLS